MICMLYYIIVYGTKNIEKLYGGTTVMSDTMLICQALDERDFLRKKIMSAIEGAKLIAVKRVRDEKIMGKYGVDEFEKNAQSDFQSINDMIKRYQAIDTAITLSNATTEIEVADRKMTVAAAISLRKSLLSNGSQRTDFTGTLLYQMKRQFESASRDLAELNARADAQAEAQKMAMIGKDTKKTLDEADIKAIATITDPLRGELIDPIKLEGKIKTVADSYDRLVKELETAIKVSNATTSIEV